jgi:hypothetical protein
MSIFISSYLEYVNNIEYRTKWFYINANWFSSWLFILPLLYEQHNINANIDYHIMLYFMLLPSIIRHAHIWFITHKLVIFEKWLIITSIIILLTIKVDFIRINGRELCNMYDVGIFASITLNSYIYFIKNLSHSKYGVLWHCLIHLIGSLGLVCQTKAYHIIVANYKYIEQIDYYKEL